MIAARYFDLIREMKDNAYNHRLRLVESARERGLKPTARALRHHRADRSQVAVPLPAARSLRLASALSYAPPSAAQDTVCHRSSTGRAPKNPSHLRCPPPDPVLPGFHACRLATGRNVKLLFRITIRCDVIFHAGRDCRTSRSRNSLRATSSQLAPRPRRECFLLNTNKILSGRRYQPATRIHFSFAYSAFAAMRMGMSGSASFHSVRKS
jgi:hypothetical protein